MSDVLNELLAKMRREDRQAELEISEEAVAIALDPVALEALIRRAIREEVRQELRRLREDPLAILYDWRHEGPDDPEGDEILARDAVELSQVYRESPGELTSLEDFQEELARAEAAGELPD